MSYRLNPKGIHHGRCNNIPKDQETHGPKLIPDELIDQLLAQRENKDAESILGESEMSYIFHTINKYK